MEIFRQPMQFYVTINERIKNIFIIEA